MMQTKFKIPVVDMRVRYGGSCWTLKTLVVDFVSIELEGYCLHVINMELLLKPVAKQQEER